ncbi:CU044_5270 family protein [Nonomuraea harbinensis]|uniref:CU044_5270 family protein n=1 Tax=Nonomuraea harbinensis TaxID=1286938 RepID=A0ABW1BN19_9ACTN|nr:CU044_5270 family protein [Nonomuraea harbinensis]
MDDLSALVRELYGDPPADPFARGRVEARLQARTRRRVPWKAGVAGLAAAMALGAAIVVPNLGTHATRDTFSGNPILLTAATMAEAAPTGSYWHVKRLYTMRWDKLYGSGGNTYRLETSNLAEQWVSTDGRVWSGHKRLAARPLDEAAWRRDGAPTEWKAGDGVHSTTPGEGRLTEVAGGGSFRFGGEDLTPAQLAELPTDPAALTERARRVIRADGVEEGSVSDVVPTTLATLLYELPAAPEVRAAAYRALATLPRVTVEEGAEDPTGRPGVSVSFPLQHDQPTRGRLIVDPGTSMVLAYEVTGAPGKGDRTEVVLASGWTDAEPAPPTTG